MGERSGRLLRQIPANFLLPERGELRTSVTKYLRLLVKFNEMSFSDLCVSKM